MDNVNLTGTTESRLRPRPWSRIAERIVSTRRSPEEERRALPVVIVVVIGSMVAGGLLARLPEAPHAPVHIVAVIALVGMVAEVLSFNESNKKASGSIAQIPFIAAGIIAPTLSTVALVALAQAIALAWHRRPWLKSVFNIAQGAMAIACGMLVFRVLGDSSALRGDFNESVKHVLLPATALTAVHMLVNTVAVFGVISAVTRSNFFEVWYRANRKIVPAILVNVALSLYLSWLTLNLGPLGTLGMVFPLLAVRQLARTTVELTNVTEELLDLMVAAIEARDPYTSGHSKRVASASRIIAEAMGLKPEQCERVEVAALLHDVGKIDEQFARILAKEGRLTPEEWETMKRHPVRSAQLVGMLSSLKDIVPAVRHHHENWDGTGYPDGISGTAIPLGSRIIMFADTLDAITTDRPYRKALDPEEARREFIKFRGKQFDPGVCDVVISPSVWSELYRRVRESHAGSGQADVAKDAVA